MLPLQQPALHSGDIFAVTYDLGGMDGLVAVGPH